MRFIHYDHLVLVDFQTAEHADIERNDDNFHQIRQVREFGVLNNVDLLSRNERNPLHYFILPVILQTLGTDDQQGPLREIEER